VSIWGYYEKLSVQGTKRKAKIYIPSLLQSALPPFVFFALPIAGTLSGSDKGRSLLVSPWSMALTAVFFLFFFAIGLMGVWAGVCEQRDVKRMRSGELVLRSGELFILSRTSTIRYHHDYRFAIRNQQGRGRNGRGKKTVHHLKGPALPHAEADGTFRKNLRLLPLYLEQDAG